MTLNKDRALEVGQQDCVVHRYTWLHLIATDSPHHAHRINHSSLIRLTESLSIRKSQEGIMCILFAMRLY
jgi:hypothetical protein